MTTATMPAFDIATLALFLVGWVALSVITATVWHHAHRRIRRCRFTGTQPGWPAVTRQVYDWAEQDLPVPPPPRPQMTGPTVDMDRFRGKDMTVWGYDE